MTKQTKPVQIGLACFAFTRRRRTHHLHDGSFGIAQGCRPGNEGKAPLSPAHLMQKRALIAMQYSALHHRTWITPTVQKPCSHGLQNKKAMKSFDFTAFSGAMEGTRTPGLLIRSARRAIPSIFGSYVLTSFPSDTSQVLSFEFLHPLSDFATICTLCTF